MVAVNGHLWHLNLKESFRFLNMSEVGKVLSVGETYIICESDTNTGKAIVCVVCGYKSWNAYDISSKYCFKCKKFHYQLERDINDV